MKEKGDGNHHVKILDTPTHTQLTKFLTILK